MLNTIALYMPEAGNPVAGFLSVVLATMIAFWGPLRQLVYRAVRQTVVIEEDWKDLLRKRQESSPAVTLDEVLLARARSDPNIVLAVQARPQGGEVWFRDPRGKVASLPFKDLKEAA